MDIGEAVVGLGDRYERKLGATDLLRAWAECDIWSLFEDFAASVARGTNNFALSGEQRLLLAADAFELASLQALLLRAVMLRTMELENPDRTSRPTRGRSARSYVRLADELAAGVAHELRTRTKLDGWSRGNPRPHLWNVRFGVLEVGHDLIWGGAPCRLRVAGRLLDTAAHAVLLRDLIVGRRPIRLSQLPREARRLLDLAAAASLGPVDDEEGADDELDGAR